MAQVHRSLQQAGLCDILRREFPRMQTAITRAALGLALIFPAVYGQLSYPGLTRVKTFVFQNHVAMSLYVDESDNCEVIYYTVKGLIFGQKLTPVGVTILAGPVPATTVSAQLLCLFTIALKHVAFSGSERPKPQTRLSRTDASSASTSQQVWIASDTPPSTAPNASGGVYVIDPSTFDTVASIPLPGTIASSPTALATNNAGTYVYAVISAPAGTTTGSAMIAVINTSSYSIAQIINLPQGVSPGTPALSANDRYLYVPNSGTGGGVLVIDTQNPSSITTIPTTMTYPKTTEQLAPAQVALTPDGELLFAWGLNTFAVIDTTTGQQVGQIIVPEEQNNQFFQNQLNTGVNYFVVDPTGSRIYAFANYGSGPSNTFTGYLYAYDTASLSQVGSVELGQNVDLDYIAITPDGSTVFVSEFVYADGQNPIFLVDAQSLAVTQANLTAPPLSESDTGLWQTMQVVLQ